MKKGYHITKRSNLYSIQKNGLQPKIGRSSFFAGEYAEIICFALSLDSIAFWKNRLYENESLKDLAVLSFDLTDIKYTQRNFEELFTEDAILPERICLVDVALNHETNELYQISEIPITEIPFKKPEIDNETREQVTEVLADYEHKKWSKEFNRVEWKGIKNSDGSLEISLSDISRMKKYMTLDYSETEDWYKKEIRNTIMETFFILQDYNMIAPLEMPSEELLSMLERIEYQRRNRWNKHMLSCCYVKDGKYVIPTEKLILWHTEMITPYSMLNESAKDSDKREVLNIFSEIQNKKTNIHVNINHSPTIESKLNNDFDDI